jgi:cell division protease FtsH
MEEVKGELMEIVDYLKNPDKYTKVGARIPK